VDTQRKTSSATPGSSGPHLVVVRPPLNRQLRHTQLLLAIPLDATLGHEAAPCERRNGALKTSVPRYQLRVRRGVVTGVQTRKQLIHNMDRVVARQLGGPPSSNTFCTIHQGQRDDRYKAVTVFTPPDSSQIQHHASTGAARVHHA